MQTCDMVYKIPCKNCDKAYIGETGRKFGTRLKEHQADVNANSSMAFTRAERLSSQSDMHKSAITDHVTVHNHVID